MDYTKVTGKATSAGQSSSILSAQNALSSSISNQVKALEQADLKQKTAGAIISAAQKVNDELNNMVSGLCKPIFDAIQEFKTVPPKIRSIVDINGAANGMYNKLDKCQQSMQSLSSIIISVEVPITLDDYNADPYNYENLLAVQYQKNEVTEEDCVNSGYTKIETTINPQWLQRLVDLFQAPEDRDVVGKAMEKLIGSTIKTAWNIVASPIQTVASIAPLGPISEMVNSIIGAIDNVVKIASMTVSEDKLNQMIAEKQAAAEKAAAEAAAAAATPNPTGMSLTRLSEQAQKQSDSMISQVTSGVANGIAGAFENMQAPEFPDDVKHTIEDFKDSLIMVKDNISNIYIVVLLKMMGAIFDCFNQIIGVLGVPSIPDPLGKIPQLLADINNVMTFVMGLPMSLVKCVEAILKRKMKMIQVGMTPIPPKPLPTLVPIPPTSKDVVKPDTTWDNVVQKLVDDYNFSQSDAKAISDNIQKFYDGSDAEGFSTGVINGAQEKNNQYGLVDWLPTYKYLRRYKMEALECFEKYIPTNVVECKNGLDRQYIIPIPKLNNGHANAFYKYNGPTRADVERIDCSLEPCFEDYFSQVKKS